MLGLVPLRLAFQQQTEGNTLRGQGLEMRWEEGKFFLVIMIDPGDGEWGQRW